MLKVFSLSQKVFWCFIFFTYSFVSLFLFFSRFFWFILFYSTLFIFSALSHQRTLQNQQSFEAIKLMTSIKTIEKVKITSASEFSNWAIPDIFCELNSYHCLKTQLLLSSYINTNNSSIYSIMMQSFNNFQYSKTMVKIFQKKKLVNSMSQSLHLGTSSL